MSVRFELPAGKYIIQVSKQGYETKKEELEISADTNREITLQPTPPSQQPPQQPPPEIRLPISGRALLIGAIATAGLLLLLLLLRGGGRRRSRRGEDEE